MLGGDQLRHERLAGWAGECSCDSNQEQNGEDGSNGLRWLKRMKEQKRRPNGQRKITQGEDDSPVEPVSGASGRQGQENAGKKLHQSYITEIEGASGELIDLPGYGYRNHFIGNDEAQASGLEIAVAGILKGYTAGIPGVLLTHSAWSCGIRRKAGSIVL